MTSLAPLIDENVGLLEQATVLIEEITDEQYVAPVLGPRGGSIGAQLRHVLDFHACLLRDLDSGHIEYDRRDRDPRVEVERTRAIDRLRACASRLRALVTVGVPRVLLVRADEPAAAGAPRWAQSSLERELQCLSSHTVHHYALVALMLRTLGASAPAEFGVAPSTLAYWRTRARTAA
jgi:uncharacterized damage-inducible protein DinB